MSCHSERSRAEGRGGVEQSLVAPPTHAATKLLRVHRDVNPLQRTIKFAGTMHGLVT